MGPTDPSIWNEEIPVPVSTISYVDEAIAKKLPAGTKILGISSSGASYWARTAKIEALDENGDKDNYFVKIHQGKHGKDMVSSEAASMATLYQVVPEMVAKPMGWGTFASMEDTHFVLCKYHDMSDDIPRKDFTALVADMHRRGVSPNGKFGNPNVTFGGRNPQLFPVTDTWEECFIHGMKAIFAAEKQTQGPDEELEYLEQAMIDQVFPRLLRALETGDRKIVPRLVHGDLWEGNTSVDRATGSPMIFDATPLYAHNEYELGPWLPPRHRFPPYIAEYTKYFPVSDPQEEFMDRVTMYCLRFDMHGSSLYPGNLRFRNLSKDAMRRLLERYGEGALQCLSERA